MRLFGVSDLIFYKIVKIFCKLFYFFIMWYILWCLINKKRSCLILVDRTYYGDKYKVIDINIYLGIDLDLYNRNRIEYRENMK